MSKNTWLTQTQYDRLTEELEQRSNVDRPRIASLIELARQEGDLSENGGYQAAREEQSMNETRIIQLEQLLEDAQVGQVPEDDGVVAPGMVVTANVDGDEETFLLASRDAGTDLNVEVYSPTAPLGKAIIGAKQGETVAFETPTGATLDVEILQVHPYEG